MRLISWNVAGRWRRLDEQVQALNRREPDIVALQEVTARTALRLRVELGQAGLSYGVDSLDLTIASGRRYGELLVSRWPMRLLPQPPADQPFPERMLSAVADCPPGSLEVHTVHIVPGSQYGWLKIEMLRFVHEQLAHHSRLPRILCGDFN